MRVALVELRSVAALAFVTCAIGCAGPVGKTRPAESIVEGRASPDRKLVRSGELAISVDSLDATSAEVQSLVKDAGGFVERSADTKESSVWLHCRVPAAKLDGIMDAVAHLGEERRRSVSAADVTEQLADLETRLRNNIALRDRLQELLQRASDVEDVLAIEKELNRVQSEIETMQARFDRLESEVELSALSINLRRKRTLGPLGHVGYGLWWGFSKLFVIR